MVLPYVCRLVVGYTLLPDTDLIARIGVSRTHRDVSLPMHDVRAFMILRFNACATRLFNENIQ